MCRAALHAGVVDDREGTGNQEVEFHTETRSRTDLFGTISNRVISENQTMLLIHISKQILLIPLIFLDSIVKFSYLIQLLLNLKEVP